MLHMYKEYIQLYTIIAITLHNFLSPHTGTISFVTAKKSIPSTKQSYLYPTTTQWNPSPNIDEQGFFKKQYRRILGDWEIEANIGGRYGYKSTYSKDIETVPVTIRQVPGDGNCLFHSLSVGLNYVETKRHLHMQNEIQSSWDDVVNSHNNDHHSNGQTLHERSNLLRQIAVDMLMPNNDEHKDNSIKSMNNPDERIRLPFNKKRIRRRRRKPLFIQGNEYLHVDELLQLAGSQYDLTGLEYCNMMRKNGVWGGGPEIVALCNYLKRPIHVYELVTVHPPPPSAWKYSQFRNGMLTLMKRNSNKYSSADTQGHDQDYHHHQTKLRSSNQRISRLCEGSKPEFRLRRMACFGSPKFDSKEPIHILSADCRFPEISPGKEASNGNHFLAIFPSSKGCIRKSSSKLAPEKLRSVKVRSGALKQSLLSKDGYPNRNEIRTKWKLRNQRKLVQDKKKHLVLIDDEGIISCFGLQKMLYRWLRLPSYASLFDEWMKAI